METLSQDDILAFVTGSFETCHAYHERRAAFGEATEKLVEDVVTKANGVFLWVRLVMKELLGELAQGATLDELQSVLSELPQDMRLLFRRIWRKIDPKNRRRGSCYLQAMVASSGIIRLDSPLLWIMDGET
jgi:hypothetical protein